MKKIISILLSASLIASIPAYIASAQEENVVISAPASVPSEWALEEIEKASMKGIITDAVCVDFQSDITRGKFCELVMTAYEKLNKESISTEGISFTDTDNESILKASAVGIVNGYGDGIFAPDDKITREQIATMLVRMLDKANIGLDVNKYEETSFADKESISDWALASVSFAYDAGIMKGKAEATIDPRSNTSCEEAILLTYRTYNKFAYYGKKTLAQSLGDAFDKIATDEKSALSIADELMKSEFIFFSPATMEKEDKYLQGFGEHEIKGYKECAMFSPMVGTIPFMGYIFTVDEENAEVFKAELEEKANLNWNICTTADELLVKVKGNKVFFVMCPYGAE